MELTELQLRSLIRNAHARLGTDVRYKGKPLWFLVADLFGFGSTHASETCREAGFYPHQKCGAGTLKVIDKEIPF